VDASLLESGSMLNLKRRQQGRALRLAPEARQALP
jgi:hypothetical protein